MAHAGMTCSMVMMLMPITPFPKSLETAARCGMGTALDSA